MRDISLDAHVTQKPIQTLAGGVAPIAAVADVDVAVHRLDDAVAVQIDVLPIRARVPHLLALALRPSLHDLSRHHSHRHSRPAASCCDGVVIHGQSHRVKEKKHKALRG